MASFISALNMWSFDFLRAPLSNSFMLAKLCSGDGAPLSPATAALVHDALREVQHETDDSDGAAAAATAALAPGGALLGPGNGGALMPVIVRARDADAPAPEPAPQPARSAEKAKKKKRKKAAWNQHLDPATGRYYYHNRALGVTTWERPAEMDAPQLPADATPADSAA